MRLFLFILLCCNVALSQQSITICNDEPQTFLYSAESSESGETEWQVDGQYYYGNPVAITWLDTGVFTITAIHYALNCPSEPVTYVVTVTECDPLIYYVPNSFTPDKDEVNNSWGPVFTSGFDPQDFHLLIFNRWGEIVWESFDHTVQWDGTYAGRICQNGTYTWVIWFGDKYTDARYKEIGHVTIIK